MKEPAGCISPRMGWLDWPENFQGPPEVGQDSVLGHGGGTGYDSKPKTTLELNMIQFLFYLG